MTCHCGQPPIRSLGTTPFCAAHYDKLLDSFHPEAFMPIGVGRSITPVEGGLHLLACRACQATWHGTPGDDCVWCQRAHQTMLDHQADLLLQPPDVDRDDLTWGPRMEAWALRLARSVKAGLISASTAERAVLREVDRAA